MKQIILYFLLAIFFGFDINFAQDSKKKMNDYKSDWAYVLEDEQKALPKSALEKVNKIYTKAQREENHSQLIKSVLHKVKYIGQVEESAFEKSIFEIQNEIAISKGYSKAILQSILGEIFSQYYQNNMYAIMKRTETKKFSQSDLATYDAAKLVEATIAYYTESSSGIEETKKILLEDIEPLLNSEGYPIPNGRILRSTLYDFLTHRAIDFFSNQDHSLTKPADTFLLDKKEYFSSNDKFAALYLQTLDNRAYKFYAIKLLQDITKFHLNDKKPDALFEINLKRLQFIYQHSNLEDKGSIYKKELETLERRYSTNPISTEASFLLATLQNGKSHLYAQSRKEEDRLYSKTAYDICSKAISKFPDSFGASSCKSLQASILHKSLTISIEKNNSANKPSLGFLEYRNLTKIHFKIFKVNREIMKDVREAYQAFLKKNKYNANYEMILAEFFKNKKEYDQFTIKLEDKKDYISHSVEFKIPELQLGQYLILGSMNEDFSLTNNAFGYAFTNISQLSFVDKTTEKGDLEGFVVDRDSGNPISDVEIFPYHYFYDNKKNQYVSQKEKTIFTDKNGFYKITSKKDQYKQYRLTFKKGEDSFEPIDDYYSPYENGHQYNFYVSHVERYSNNQGFAKLFLDRAIYRPGQPIYFKGILIQANEEKRKIMTATSVAVTFYNVNQQIISTLNLTTNEFGTFSGSFIAPVGVLNGAMSIRTNYNSYNTISVEDYKRPKFKVEFEDVKGTYKPNDLVKITGSGKAFSGANIDNAEVSYRVIRTVEYPWWWGYSSFFRHSTNQMEIKNGKTVTDEKGNFQVEFEAIPDSTIEKNPSVKFSYKVLADITDMNGETQTSSKIVYVGYTLLQASVDVPADINLKSNAEFTISTTNLNGIFESAIGYISVHKLKPYARALKPRKWAKPDLYLYNEKEFHKDFPFNVYKDEDNFMNWERGEEVVNLPFNTSSEKKIRFKNLENWKVGKYVLEIKTFDKLGSEVKNIHYFNVYSDNPKSEIPNPNFLIVQNLTRKLEPGETAKFLLGSSETVDVFYELHRGAKLLKREWIELKKNQKQIDYQIEEEDRGGISLHYFYVTKNHLFVGNDSIQVPYSNKELKISYETFRDKLQPGEEETWKLKISGSKSEKVAAELLAAMYDSSLDSFASNNWDFSIYALNYNSTYWRSSIDFTTANFPMSLNGLNAYHSAATRSYDNLNWFGVSLYNFRGFYPHQPRRYKNGRAPSGGMRVQEEADYSSAEMAMSDALPSPAPVATMGKAVGSLDKEKKDFGVANKPEDAPQSEPVATNDKAMSGIKARSNFRETAFFLPHLQTEKDGTIVISFKLPDALTKWKFMTLAHTKDLKFALDIKEIIAQKDLMVIPNPPRFFREDDTMEFTTKVTNLVDKDLSGKIQIEFSELSSGKDVTDLVLKDAKLKDFTSKAKQSSVVNWNLFIPKGLQGLSYKIIAKSGEFSDGEEMPIPVLTNRMLVTETMPLWINDNKPKTFRLEKLLANKSDTLVHHTYTLEYTSNPAWYAVQALPYIMEYPYECAEQLFSRFYANSLGTHIANSNPKIKKVFDSWVNGSKKRGDGKENASALISNLEKNQELKNILLEETPWVLDAKDETESKKRVGLLFDLMKMSNELERAFSKLKKMQSGNGGFAWFKGMKEDRYITQHIVTGIGHLLHLGVNLEKQYPEIKTVSALAIQYLDAKILEDYQYLLKLEKEEKLSLKDQQISYLQIQYLYARSFFKEVPIPEESKISFEYYKWQANTYWTSFITHKISAGQIALALYRLGENTPKEIQKLLLEKKITDFKEKKVPEQIVKSLTENSLNSDELGMYWKQSWGYYWYELPIETQSMMIEVYDEIAKDDAKVNALKTWLLKNKQTNDWKTTKATSDAIYALLLKGDDWLETEPTMEFTIGGKKLNLLDDKTIQFESGTGYFKKSFDAKEIKNEMGEVKIIPNTSKKAKPSWGGIYWQYFENLDKITSAETPLKLQKKVFLQVNSKTGPIITPIEASAKLKPGDLLKIRIELRVDRDMEYVHMKDLRASTLEPTNVFSGYRWQDGLGYYETTRDTATNFFFDSLPKGTYVFEYPLRVTHKGNFSNGITQIQSMYAPEFTSHSEGIRIKVGD